MQQTKPKPPLRHLRAILFGLGLSVFAGSVPALAQTIYDTNVANKISGISPQVRAQIQAIQKQSKVQLMAVFQKYGIDPNAKPVMNKLMNAADDLQAVARAERTAVQKLLQPEEMAQYDTAVSETTQRIRDAAN